MNLTKKQKRKVYKFIYEAMNLSLKLELIESLLIENDKITLTKEEKDINFKGYANICEMPEYKGRYFLCRKNAKSEILNKCVMESNGECPETCRNLNRRFYLKKIKIS